MLRWSLTFFIFSIVAAILGFGGVAVATADIAQILFYVFLVLFCVSIFMGFARKGDRTIGKNL